MVKFAFPFPALAYQQDTTSAHSLHMSGKGTGIAVTHLHQIHRCHWPVPFTPPLGGRSGKIWEPLHHCKPGQGAPIETRCAGPRFSLPTIPPCVCSEAGAALIQLPWPAQNRALSTSHSPARPRTECLLPFPSQARSMHIPGKLLHGCFC